MGERKMNLPIKTGHNPEQFTLDLDQRGDLVFALEFLHTNFCNRYVGAECGCLALLHMLRPPVVREAGGNLAADARTCLGGGE